MFMQLISDIWHGARFVIKGCCIFFTDRKTWKYSIPPLLGVAVLYCILWWLIFALCRGGAQALADLCAKLPNWLVWIGGLAGGLTFVAGTLVALLLIAVTFSTLYEFFGGIFFDYLVEYIGRTKYQIQPAPFSIKRMLSFTATSCLWGIQTLFYFFFFFLLSLFIPIIGPIILVLAMGYNFGITYMMSANDCYEKPLKKLKNATNRNAFTVIGFGATAYFLLCLPFAAIILLPGIVIGGTMLYHEKIKEYV